jgi:RNA polymerase sigma-70 factor, ECF subfamily
MQHGDIPGCLRWAMQSGNGALAETVATAGDNYDERFSSMRPRLFAIATSLAGIDAAQDIVQDTYVRGRSKLHQLRDVASFEAWMARIAVNACYNHRRGLRWVVADLAGGENPAHSSESRDIGLRELIERLPPRERTVVVLHYGHGYRLDEIAQFLELTHTNVRSIAHRARRRLAGQWEESTR